MLLLPGEYRVDESGFMIKQEAHVTRGPFHKTVYDQAQDYSGRNFGTKSRKDTKLCFIKRRKCTTDSK